MIPDGSSHQSPSYDYDFPTLQPPSPFYTQRGNFDVYYPPMARLCLDRVPPGVYAFDLNHYYSDYDKHESVSAPPPPPPVEPYLPMSSFKKESLFDGSQTGIRVGHGRSFCDVPENIIQSRSTLLVTPSDLLSNGTVGSTGTTRTPRSSQTLQFLCKEKGQGSGVSSLYQRPNTLVADSENGVSESSLKDAIDDLDRNGHRYWNRFMVSSQGPSAPTDNENAAQSQGCANQPSEDVQASQKTFKLQEQLVDIMNRDKKTTLLTHLRRSNADGVSTGQGDFTSQASSTRLSSVVSAIHNLSQVLVYECFNNGRCLKLEQLDNLDQVVENLTKCLKKITIAEMSADASTVMQESDPIMNIVEQETTESLINCGNSAVTMSHDTPQSSRFNSAPIGAVLSLLSSSVLEQENHGNLKPGVQISDSIQQESPASTTEGKHNDVIDRFEILKLQETKRKLKSRNCPDPYIGVIDRFQILKQQRNFLGQEVFIPN